MTADAAGMLGLPNSDVVGQRDPTLRDEYAAFIAQLEVLVDGRVVLSGPYQLSVNAEGISKSAERWFAGLSEKDRCRLLLLSIVGRPFDAESLSPAGQSRFGDDPVVSLLFGNDNPQSLAEQGGGMPFGLGTIEGRKKLSSEPALVALCDQLPTRAAIETLSAEFIGAMPGNYGYQMWQIAEWSADWAVVFGITDAGYNEGYPFPWLLGFCKRDSLERNFITLLREGSARYDIGFYNTYGRVTSRWPIAELALVVDEDSEQPDWDTIEWLLEIDDEALRRLIHDYTQDMTLPEFVLRMRDLHDLAQQLDTDDVSLRTLMERAQADGSLDVLEARLEEWVEVLRERL